MGININVNKFLWFSSEKKKKKKKCLSAAIKFLLKTN